MGKLDGRIAIVTGGGSGIGKASALKMASEGAGVMVADLREEIAADVAKEISEQGGKAISIKCDVGSEEDIIKMTSRTIDELGGVDILVTSAGNVTRGGIHELTLSDWNRVIKVQLTGTFLSARESLKHMLKNGGGSIITIGSVSSVIIAPGGSAASYKAAKGGVLQLTRAIAVEYAHLGVRANCVCPGAITTNLGKHTREEAGDWTTEVNDEIRQYKIDVPMKRSADPMEVGNVVSFLATDDASFMTGSAVMVDGGFTAI